MFAPLNQDYYTLLDRYEIKANQHLSAWNTQLKPYPRSVIAHQADSVWSQLPQLSAADRFNLQYFQNDNWEWSSSTQTDSRRPVFRHLYRKKADFYHHQDRTFELHINPVLGGFVGIEQDQENTPYMNARGLEIRGMLGQKIGFYSYVTDTQADFPQYVVQRIDQKRAMPGEGFYKRNTGEGTDFLTARGYLTFEVLPEILQLQFGYDKNFVGNGYRSMILSDFSSNYLFLKLNTNVWKLNYQNIFAQMVAENLQRDGLYPTKYFALHHLSIDVRKNFTLGLFESVVFNRGDTLSNFRGTFDFRYLNPVIFYRAIEQQAGSPDNANLGLDFRWSFLKHFQLYGQLLIDEFVFSDLRSRNGSRRNKQAGQIGFKYVDVAGVANLDLQGEINIARPYTYSHNFLYSEYSNYNQELAHPLGANFYEYLGIVRYQPLSRLHLTALAVYARYGTDETGRNWGGNIFLNNSDFERETGNEIGQGVATHLLLLEFTASWQLFHNMFVEFKQLFRKIDSDDLAQNRETLFSSLQFRWNIPQRSHIF
ncbi:MAG: hypothetical protein OHK0053_25170 [Microscillaceae bacterium]